MSWASPSPVTSPTFTIGTVLRGRDLEVAHLDLYRLSSLAGEDPALLDDYLTPDRIAFVEWPGVAEELPLRVAARVRLEHAGRRSPPHNGRMTLLGLDTSTAASAAAVLCGRWARVRGAARPRAPARSRRRTLAS